MIGKRALPLAMSKTLNSRTIGNAVWKLNTLGLHETIELRFGPMVGWDSMCKSWFVDMDLYMEWKHSQ